MVHPHPLVFDFCEEIHDVLFIYTTNSVDIIYNEIIYI